MCSSFLVCTCLQSVRQNFGEFTIGALTPSITYDLRDNRVNPMKGAFLTKGFLMEELREVLEFIIAILVLFRAFIALCAI